MEDKDTLKGIKIYLDIHLNSSIEFLEDNGGVENLNEYKTITGVIERIRTLEAIKIYIKELEEL